jgi:single-stranded-DNA-specific exonuclease
LEALSYRNASWEAYPQISSKQFRLFRDAGIDPILTQLLHNRGIQTLADMQIFLKADYRQTRDPFALIDMSRAVARIERALAEGEHITVYGDYDADGVTSSALLFRALRSLKKPDAHLDFHIPHRLRDGCGLNYAAIDLLKARGTRLIITTDCASSDVEQVGYANTLGIDVIITDHHHPPAQIPPAYAMVNPWRSECTYGERYLCGVGIAFKLTQALYRNARRPEEDELDLLDLVAIGTIGDIAPLLGENHVLVRLGMQRLNNTQKPGLQALIRNAKQFPGRIQERDIAFGLAPRLNAAGRMKEASLSFRLLTTESTAEATTLAAELEHLNSKRQQETEELVRAIRLQADEQRDEAVILVHGNDWHEGIIGLVAGKLAEEINKPVFVLSDDPQTRLSRGSARSQKHFSIIAALRAFDSHLERYGGHTQAAGFTIKTEHIQQLHTHLLDCYNTSHQHPFASNEMNELPPPTGLVIEQESPPVASPSPGSKMVDLVFTKIERLNESTYKLLQQLGPFGANNPEPVFNMKRLHLLDKWTSGYNKQNLRLRLGTSQGELMGTYTRGAQISERLATTTHVNVIFQLAISENDNHPDIWLKILDIEAART